jgi:hypothetical protein
MIFYYIAVLYNYVVSKIYSYYTKWSRPKYIKVLSENLKHYNFIYKEGLNIDHIPFNTDANCKSGGLYFTTIEHVYGFLLFGALIADVEIPTDAKVVHLPNKSKADKIIIKNIRRWDTELDLEKIIKINSSHIQFIQNPSEKLQLLAIFHDAISIKFINNPSYSAKLAAVKKDGTTIKYINDYNDEIARCAIIQSPFIFKVIKKPNYKLQRLAVKLLGLNIRYIVNPLESVQLLAVKNDGIAIRYILNPSKRVKRAAAKTTANLISAFEKTSIYNIIRG